MLLSWRTSHKRWRRLSHVLSRLRSDAIETPSRAYMKQKHLSTMHSLAAEYRLLSKFTVIWLIVAVTVEHVVTFLRHCLCAERWCVFQTATAMVTVQHQFGRQGVFSEQWRNVLLYHPAVCHVADGHHNNQCMRLSNDQTYRSSHVHSLHPLRRRHFTARVQSSALRTVFVLTRDSSDKQHSTVLTCTVIQCIAASPV